jgi:hypothetical protein
MSAQDARGPEEHDHERRATEVVRPQAVIEREWERTVSSTKERSTRLHRLSRIRSQLVSMIGLCSTVAAATFGAADIAAQQNAASNLGSVRWHAIDANAPWQIVATMLPVDYYDGGPGANAFGSPIAPCGSSGTYASMARRGGDSLDFLLVTPSRRHIERITVPFSPATVAVSPGRDVRPGAPTELEVGFRSDKHVVFVGCNQDASRLILQEATPVISLELAEVHLAYGVVEVKARRLSILGVTMVANTLWLPSAGNDDGSGQVVGNPVSRDATSIVAPDALRPKLEAAGLHVVSLDRLLSALRQVTGSDKRNERLLGWTIYHGRNSIVMPFHWIDRDQPDDCSLTRFGFMRSSSEQGRPTSFCELGSTFYRRPVAPWLDGASIWVEMGDGRRCSSPNSNRHFLGTVEGLSPARLSSCTVTSQASIEGEAFSPDGRQRWVVLARAPVPLTPGQPVDDPWILRQLERISLYEATGETRQPITKTLASERQWDSHCMEIEPGSPTQHVFYCPDGWLIHATRESATR